MLAVLQASSPHMQMCLVWMFDEMIGVDGTALLSHFECPLISLSRTVKCVSPHKILKPISIAHECDNSCRLIDSQFHHDYSNEIFSINIYCINSF